jgi:hypothetical protein
MMRWQGLGGSSVSKTVLVPGQDAVAYGGSKAALLRRSGWRRWSSAVMGSKPFNPRGQNHRTEARGVGGSSFL